VLPSAIRPSMGNRDAGKGSGMTYLGIRVTNWLGLAVVSLALGLGLAVSGLLPQPSECELLYVEPSGPEPGVPIWDAHWDCAGERLTQQYVTDSPYVCGAVWEESRWIEAGCESEKELAGRLAQIRAERSGEREWQ
jgi:hypothetical protein